jgi:hypothetical protein
MPQLVGEGALTSQRRAVVQFCRDQKHQNPKYPKLDKDVRTDVVIVGAGIAGLSIAYNLVKEGECSFLPVPLNNVGRVSLLLNSNRKYF